MNKSRLLALLAASLLIAGNILAQDNSEKPATPKDKPAAGQHAMAIPVPMIKIPGVEWTDDQQAKIKEYQKEIVPKIAGAAKKMEGLLTAEQKKARTDAVKAAQAAGKKPPEIMAAVKEAIKLTDEQKKQAAEIQQDMKSTQQEFVQKVMGLLTPEQRQQLMEKGGAKKG
jgi:hypothetical protein